MVYSDLLTRHAALLSILVAVSLASPEPQAVVPTAVSAAAVYATASGGAAPVATSQPTCLGVGASVIPDSAAGAGAGANPDGSTFDSGDSSSIDGSSGDGFSQRRDLFPDEMDGFLYERQDPSAAAAMGSSGTTSFAGGPISIPPNTTFCGWLGGTGMQSDMVSLPAGIFQLTWQNVTGDGQVSINYAQAGVDSQWAPQDSETPGEWPTVESFPNDGVQYQVVYLGEYATNGLNWFLTQVG